MAGLGGAASVRQVSISQFDYAWEIQAYLRFAGADFDEINVDTPSSGNSGNYPQLRIGNQLYGPTAALQAAREQSLDLDAHLRPEHVAERNLLVSCVRHELLPALLYLRWVEGVNGPASALAPAAKALPAVFGRWLLHRHRNAIVSRCAAYGVTSAEEASSAAELACRTLSARLEASPFYFGSRPTSLDAAVFGAVCQLHESSPEVLEGLSVLADFRKRVLETYFVPAPTGEPPSNAFLAEAGHQQWPPAAARASLIARGLDVAPLSEDEINPSAGLRAVDAGPSVAGQPGSGTSDARPVGGAGAPASSSSSAQPGWGGEGAKAARGVAARWTASARNAWASMDSSAWAWAAVAAVTLLAPANFL